MLPPCRIKLFPHKISGFLTQVRNCCLSPELQLNNMKRIPKLGLGTFRGLESPGDHIYEAVTYAIDIGYRHIDTAYYYGNEKEVGQGVRDKIEEGIIKREDIFITSKLWNTFHSPHLVPIALGTTLKNFGLPYLDLYLMHWPMGYGECGDLHPRDRFGQLMFSDVDYLHTWAVMEKMVAAGLTTSIGVSNFNICQLERLLHVAKIKPVINQVECHPYLPQFKLSEYCNDQNIAITAYAPLGSPSYPGTKRSTPILIEDEEVLQIARELDKSPAQILIRYQIDRGHICIPKSITPDRIKMNLNVFDFKLKPLDIKKLSALDKKGCVRYIAFPEAKQHKYYPF